jgi:response regulator NasT
VGDAISKASLLWLYSGDRSVSKRITVASGGDNNARYLVAEEHLSGTTRILVANEGAEQLATLAAAAESVGAEVVARAMRVADVARVAAEEAVDLALVGLPRGESAAHALGLIGQIVQGGLCPVVVITDIDDPAFLAEAAKAGIYAHTMQLDTVPLRSAINIALARFEEHAQMKSVMERRLVIERAKGILMERYDLDERAAFDMLRRETRGAHLKLAEAADLVVRGRQMLPAEARRRRSGPR